MKGRIYKLVFYGCHCCTVLSSCLVGYFPSSELLLLRLSPVCNFSICNTSGGKKNYSTYFCSEFWGGNSCDGSRHLGSIGWGLQYLQVAGLGMLLYGCSQKEDKCISEYFFLKNVCLLCLHPNKCSSIFNGLRYNWRHTDFFPVYTLPLHTFRKLDSFHTSFYCIGNFTHFTYGKLYTSFIHLHAVIHSCCCVS